MGFKEVYISRTCFSDVYYIKLGLKGLYFSDVFLMILKSRPKARGLTTTPRGGGVGASFSTSDDLMIKYQINKTTSRSFASLTFIL